MVRLLGILTAMVVLSFGFMSCDQPDSDDENDIFAGKSYKTDSKENYEGTLWNECPKIYEYEFGTDGTVKVGLYEKTNNSGGYELQNTSYYDYTYDETKEELYLKLKKIVKGTTEYTLENVTVLADAEADAVVNLILLNDKMEFQDGESKVNYKEMLSINKKNYYTKRFSEKRTYKYNLYSADATKISTADVSFAPIVGTDSSSADIKLDGDYFYYDKYISGTVTVDEANKTFTAENVYFFNVSSYRENKIWTCYKARDSFIGSYTIVDVENNCALFTFTEEAYIPI